MIQTLVFISYSHKDEAEKDKLVSHLGVLQQDVIFWSDDILDAGVEWESGITRAMSQATVAILLISADFLTSEFILQKEVKLLLERSKNEGLYVVPVIAKACAWNRVEWLKKINVRPRNGRPIWSDGGTHVDEDLALIVDEVADVIERKRGDVELGIAPGHVPMPIIESTVDEEGAKTSKSISVLIVDDEERFRRSVIYGLKDMGISLIEAGSIDDAIKLLEEHRDIRVILLDLGFDGGPVGTALLDFIKDQASYYRVIILTGRQETFAAEQASSYKVFSYLAKVAGDAPMQTLRFAVTRALDDLRLEDISDFNHYIARYPTPFAYVYQYLESDMTPLAKLLSQKDMLEVLLNFSGIVLLSEYLHSKTRSEELDILVRSRIYKPTLGDWLNIVNEIVKRSPASGETFFLNSFLTFFTDRNKKILGDFISVRNKYIGHSVKLSDYEYEDMVRKCGAWLDSLLEDYQFITRFLLCYVLNVEIIRDKYLYRLKECVGANPQLLNSTKPLSLLLNTDHMHLVSLETELTQSLNLYPFILLENCTDCRQSEIFFYSKFSSRQLHYVSYKTGHWMIKEEGAEEYLALIGQS